MILLLTLVSLAFSGQITPKTATPIVPEYNNAGLTSDYTFYFQIETAIPEDGEIHVTFPSSIYLSGLGISVCAAEDDDGNSLSCSVSGNTVTVVYGQLTNSPIDNTNVVVIKDVVNPLQEGSTGYFKLETYSGVNLLDYTDYSGYVGISSSAPTSTAATVTCTSNCVAGGSATYSKSG